MIICGAATQPSGQSNKDLIASVLNVGGITRIDVAAAYVTRGGARDLLKALQESLGAGWPAVQKRWLIAFDYCRTEPIAAEMLANAPGSTVKIHDGNGIVLQPGCIPRIPFHPKAFLFSGPHRHAVFAGSGNVSRSGLNNGHEIGLLLDRRPPVAAVDALIQAPIDVIQEWYNQSWDNASPMTADLLSRYTGVFNSAENLQRPNPTDDDQSAPDNRRGTLTDVDLRKLRVCSHFWIQAGNVTPNLGRTRPGNQLMMKRLSRVFFGVPPRDVPQNSPLTLLTIIYEGIPKMDCSLTFSDNGMDKLTLPIPGAGGPHAYDGETLLFTRQVGGGYKLQIGTAAERRHWERKSRAIDAFFEMPPQGRQWGVF